MSPRTHQAAFIAFLMALSATPGQAAPKKSGRPIQNDHTAFELIKGLEGSWTGKKADGKPADVEYRVTAGGSAVLETLFPGTDHEMVTLYSMQRNRLVLTHYCALSNQPRMSFRRTRDPGTVHFEFVGGDNIDVKKDTHMHALDLRSEGKGALRAMWTLWEGGEAARDEIFEFRRKG